MDYIFEMIRKERIRQDAKFGAQNHSPIIWNTILAEEVGEVSKEICDGHFTKDVFVEFYKHEKAVEELIQVAAVAVAMVQSMGRNELKESAIYAPKPFVFTDWLAEVGYSYDTTYENHNGFYKCFRNGEKAVFIFDTDFGADINAESLFTDCQIPTNREQAEFLFKSFNLL